MVHDPRAGHGHVCDGYDDVSRAFVQLTTTVRHIVDPVTTVGRPEGKNHNTVNSVRSTQCTVAMKVATKFGSGRT